jgi:hypothetical protein
MASSVAPTSQVQASATFVLLIVGNKKLRGWVDLQCHKVHATFRENTSGGSKVKREGHVGPTVHTDMNTHTHTRYAAAVSVLFAYGKQAKSVLLRFRNNKLFSSANLSYLFSYPPAAFKLVRLWHVAAAAAMLVIQGRPSCASDIQSYLHHAFRTRTKVSSRELLTKFRWNLLLQIYIKIRVSRENLLRHNPHFAWTWTRTHYYQKRLTIHDICT